MSDAKMKMATMTSSTSYPVWLRWHRIAGFQKLASQEKHNDNCEKDVNCGEDNERHDQSRHGCYRLARPHHAINDPWLASCFRHDPSRLNRQKAQRTGRNQAAQKPSLIGQKPVLQP